MPDRVSRSNPPAVATGVRYIEAAAGDDGQRIDNFLARILKDVPRSLIYRILRTGEVRVNGGRAKPQHRLKVGDRVRLPPMQRKQQLETPAPSKSLREFIASAVIFEDRDLIVINKPAGVAVHGGSGLSFGIIEALRAFHPHVKELELVHRLDRETSGCLLVAKRRAVLRELHATLREREMEKRYLALVCGKWPFGRKDHRSAAQDESETGRRARREGSRGRSACGDDVRTCPSLREARDACWISPSAPVARIRSACMPLMQAIRSPGTKNMAIAIRTPG